MHPNVKGDDWPEDRVEASSVREWIQSELTLEIEPVGPIEVLASDSTSVAAIFGLDARHLWIEHPSPLWMSEPLREPNPEQSVFLKVCLSPDLLGSPGVHRVLTEYAPEYVPHLTASTIRDGQAWMLFEYANFPTVEKLDKYEHLIAAASVLGRVQAQVSRAPHERLSEMTIVEVTEMTRFFDQVLGMLGSAGLGNLRRQITEYRREFATWVNELAMQASPLSITHADLHTNNMMVRPDRRIVLCDWDGSSVSCPLLTLEMLLVQAVLFHPGQEATPPEGPVDAPWLLELFGTHLRALPWCSWERRQRGLNLGLCISPIKTVIDWHTLGRIPTGRAGAQTLAAILMPAVNRWKFMRRHGRVLADIPA